MPWSDRTRDSVLMISSTHPMQQKCPTTRVRHVGWGATYRRDWVPPCGTFGLPLSRTDWQAMPSPSDADTIWNRAAIEGGGTSPAPGDIALAALLRFHSLAMSGGVLDAIERLTEAQVGEAVQGFRWFGLDEAATFLGADAEQWRSAEHTPEVEDAMEASFDADYSVAIPSDATIASAFEEHLSDDPLTFAPVS